MRADTVTPAPLTCVLRLALAASLSLGTGTVHAVHAAHAAPSERDLAYESGVEAETAGDLGRAAAAFERAYRLTAPAETGPRLLFLRASVGARLRAAEASPLARLELCRAQALLRDYLGLQVAAPSGSPDPAAEERADLESIDRRLGAGAPSCESLLAPPVVPVTSVIPVMPVTSVIPVIPVISVIPEPVVPEPAAATPPGPAATPPPGPAPRPAPASTDRSRRNQRVSGGVALGVGATGLALLIAGVVLGRKANARGEALCRDAMIGCTAYNVTLRDLEVSGRRGDTLLTVGAVVGGLGVLSGAVLLGLGLRRRGPGRVSWAPRLAPGSAGLALSGRF